MATMRTKTSRAPKRQTHSQSPKKRSNDDVSSFSVPASSFSATRRPTTAATSQLFAELAGLGAQLDVGSDPQSLALALANSVHAAVQNAELKADPPPSDILAMMRLAELFCKTEGDVWATIDVPWEVIGKQIEIECDDKSAKKEWETLWRREDADGNLVVNLDDLFEQVYYCTQIYGQTFPLEVWDGNILSGIAFIEPYSMHVGKHNGLVNSDYSLVIPDQFDEAKFRSQVTPLAFSSFVVDQNTIATPGFRVPIRNDRLKPVYDFKLPFQRYSIPHLARAARNIMHRQIMEELRRGTIEGYINQLWVFTVGDEKWPATPTKVRRVKQIVESASKERTGALVFDHTVKVEVYAPKPLDQMLGGEAYADITQRIFADLKFSRFIVAGEIPGSGGRGGSQQVEIDLQLHLERWKKFTRRFVGWCEYISRKYAIYNQSAALKKHPPRFIPGVIGVEQAEYIKTRIMPFVMAGLLSRTTALKSGGFSYDRELEHKKMEEADAELFLPPPTFAQTAYNSAGEETRSESAPQATGRPDGNSQGGNPQGGNSQLPKPNSQKMKASLDDGGNYISGQSSEFMDEIDGQFAGMLARNSDSAVREFAKWFAATLSSRMTRAYQDGFIQWGGLGELDLDKLDSSAQGTQWHLNYLKGFLNDLARADDKLQLRHRALLYAGAVHTAYILGTQQAFKAHGATGWQRVLHPELSLSGPCQACIADSLVLHGIDAPFTEFHPQGVCSARSVQFHFNGSARATVRVPDFARRVKHAIPT